MEEHRGILAAIVVAAVTIWKTLSSKLASNSGATSRRVGNDDGANLSR